MSQPPYNGPYPGEPADPQPGQWNQPQQPQQPGQWGPPQPPGYAQQPYPQQPYPQQAQQPYAPQPGYAQQPQQYGPPPAQWGPPETLTQPTKPRGRGKLIAGTAAVIVLAGGGVATYVAFSDSSGKGGAGSPKQAVQKFVGDLNNSDFLGLLDDLAPGEKRALADPVRDEITQLKRLKVLQPNANPNKVTAVHIAATGLTFDSHTVAINDHVQIVKLTGGKIQISADARKIPLTKQFLDAAFPDGLPASASEQQTVDIGDAIKQNGGEPIHIAAEKVGDKWYPSLFYTIADYATTSAGLKTPSAADRIPDRGAASADEAVRDVITAAAQQNAGRLIELASPDELAALHDYGMLIVNAVGNGSPAAFKVNDIQFTHKSISGGERLILKSLDVEAGGQAVKVAVDNSCYTVTVGSDTKNMCAKDLIDMVLDEFSGFGGQAPTVTAAQRTAFTHLIDGLSSVGIDVSQTNGEWYVDAVHTYFDLTGTILSGLQGNDLFELIGFFRNLN